MKAAVVNQLGVAPVYGDFDDPTTERGVVADVVAASIKNLDRGLVSGRHYGSASIPLPNVAGVDGVARLDDGSLVYTSGVAPFGMMAERTVIEPARAVPVPADIDPAIAAALPNPGLSAWFSLEYAGQVQPGAHVLVLGATGVTGSVAVQLAKAVFGAGHVTVVGRNASRLQWLRANGADDVITLGDDLTERVAAAHTARPIDVVIDYLWGEPAERTLAALANTRLDAAHHDTRYVEVGSMAGPDITLPSAVLRSAGIQLLGLGLGSIPESSVRQRVGTEILPRLFAMVAAGALDLQVRRVPLSDVQRVWTEPEPSGTRTVLIP